MNKSRICERFLITTDEEDHELIERSLQGDTGAFSEIVKKYQKQILRAVLRILPDLATAEDVTQETFLKAFRKLASFEGRSSLKSWLFQIAMNTAKNKLRSPMRRSCSVDDVTISVSAEGGKERDFEIIQALVQKYIEVLPGRQKTALMLRIFEDLSFKEIAEIMECPYDTAKANYRHALMRLKQEISDEPQLKQWIENSGEHFMVIHHEQREVEV